MLATLDASVINIAFPQLTRVFRTDLATVMWVTVAYILVSSGMMLAFGKLSDSIGRKRIYTAGIAIFTIGMAACSISKNVPQIVIFRIIQAVGAAMSVGCSTAIVTEAFPPREMGKGLGMLGIAVSLGFIIGPVAGGFLLDWLGWRAIFYMRIPVGVLAFLLAFFLLEEDRARQEKVSLDISGTVTSFVGLLCLLLGMGQVKRYGLASPVVIILLGAAVLILCLFLIIESRTKDPIVDLGLFRNHTFSFAMAGLFVFFLTAPLYSIILPFFLMDAIELTASDSGLILAVIPVATMIASPFSGQFSDRFGPRWPSIAGAGMIAASFFLMSRFTLHTGILFIVFVLALLGLGVGVFQPPNNSTIMGSVEPAHFGSVSALIGTSRQVSLSIGMALTGLVFSVRQAIHGDTLRSRGIEGVQLIKRSVSPAFREVVLIIFILSVAVLILSLLSRAEKSGKTAFSIDRSQDD